MRLIPVCMQIYPGEEALSMLVERILEPDE